MRTYTRSSQCRRLNNPSALGISSCTAARLGQSGRSTNTNMLSPSSVAPAPKRTAAHRLVLVFANRALALRLRSILADLRSLDLRRVSDTSTSPTASFPSRPALWMSAARCAMPVWTVGVRRRADPRAGAAHPGPVVGCRRPVPTGWRARVQTK
ncbi:hypothetical protein GHT06_003816 [Daphnia sinensis]|uniref:Uncharacterized protein n=1 Tax=Daphnia sinensis TaxID=1820382 RepID=A0AAD5PNJ1_9CRUS|nr:hypothetical protein GHT06_003816 [Daphnia sinensis]